MGAFHDPFIQSALFLCLLSGFRNAKRILLNVTAALASRQEVDCMTAIPSGVLPKSEAFVIQVTKLDLMSCPRFWYIQLLDST